MKLKSVDLWGFITLEDSVFLPFILVYNTTRTSLKVVVVGVRSLVPRGTDPTLVVRVQLEGPGRLTREKSS